MNNNDLFLRLKQAFPEYIQPVDDDNHGNAIAQIIAPNQDSLESMAVESQGIGGLIIINQQQEQTDNQVWLRNFLPQSHYLINDVDELLAIIDGVIHNEVFWIMEYKLDETGDIDSWQSTTLIDKEDLITNPPIAKIGTEYQVLSWFGDFNKTI